MPDIILVFENLHHQLSRPNGRIQADGFRQLFGFKNRFPLPGADVAAQNIRTIPGLELIFKIIHQAFSQRIDPFVGVLGGLAAVQHTQGHDAAHQGTA